MSVMLMTFSKIFLRSLSGHGGLLFPMLFNMLAIVCIAGYLLGIALLISLNSILTKIVMAMAIFQTIRNLNHLKSRLVQMCRSPLLTT